MPGFVRYEEDGSGCGRKERSASMSQIECKLARTWTNWIFLKWYSLGCCLAPTSSSQKISGNPAYAVSAWEMYFDKKSPLIRPVCIRFVHQVGAKSLLHVWCSNCISQAVAPTRVRELKHGHYVWFSRTHTGAWIETPRTIFLGEPETVAPTRVRELKPTNRYVPQVVS